MKITTDFIKQTKRHFSASGSILLPLALKWRLVGFLASGILAIIVLPCVTTSAVSAASITLELPGKLSLAVQPDGELHSQESGAIQITSDAFAGYTFSIKSNDSTNALKNGTRTIPSIEAETDDSSFTVNHWGFKWSKKDSSASAKFLPGPTTGTQIIKTTQASETADEYTITLSAKLDYNTTPGAYSNTFTLTVTANDLSYSITYDGNSSGASNVPKQQTGSAVEGTMIEIGAAPTWAGHGFRGWCDQKTTDGTCSGQIYYPKTSYILTNSRNALTLYAMWVDTLPMQDWDGCSKLGEHSIIYLTDSRDNTTYSVSKLKDGLCWMTEDIRIGSNDDTTTLDSTTTDLSEGTFTLPQGDTAVGTAVGTEGWHAQQKDTAHIYIDATYGGYYTWFAATLGEGTSQKTSGDTQQSICPKGWRLPNKDDIDIIVSNYDGITSQQAPANFNNSKACDQTGCPRPKSPDGGYRWSSTAFSSSSAYSVDSYDEGFYIWHGNSKGFGLSVRCVAREA